MLSSGAGWIWMGKIGPLAVLNMHGQAKKTNLSTPFSLETYWTLGGCYWMIPVRFVSSE